MNPYARPASVSLPITVGGDEDLLGHFRGHETGLESSGVLGLSCRGGMVSSALPAPGS